MAPKVGRTWDGDILLGPDNPPMVTVYGLCRTDTREVFYIGQTVNPVGRWRDHRKMTGHPATCAMFVLEVVPWAISDEVEARWIRAYRDAGVRLENVMGTQNGHHARRIWPLSRAAFEAKKKAFAEDSEATDK